MMFSGRPSEKSKPGQPSCSTAHRYAPPPGAPAPPARRRRRSPSKRPGNRDAGSALDDVEHWMSHRQLPEDLRRRVRSAERYSWMATIGVNEEELLKKLPEDIQRDIRQHFLRFLEKIPLFTLKDCALSEAICDKLKHNLYISGTDILCRGHPVGKIVFVVRGKLEIISADGSKSSFNEEAVCGAELLAWYLEQSLVNTDGGNVKVRWMAERTIRCLTNAEAFVLQASDLEETILQFSTSLRNPLVVTAIRYGSLNLEDHRGKPHPARVEVPAKATEESRGVERLKGYSGQLPFVVRYNQ